MQDMLVRLYYLPSLEAALEAASGQGVTIRPALTIEKPQVVEWMQSHFPVWVAETEAAFCRSPVSCSLAVRGRELLGFACYDATSRCVRGSAFDRHTRGLSVRPSGGGFS